MSYASDKIQRVSVFTWCVGVGVGVGVDGGGCLNLISTIHKRKSYLVY